MPPIIHEALTDVVIGGFYETYRLTGYGYLEATYQGSLVIELRRLGFQVDNEVHMRLFYRGTPVGDYRLDIVVNDTLLIECKACEKIVRAHEAQLLNYLNASGFEVGLLFNFGPQPSFRRFVRTTKPHRPTQLSMVRKR